MIICFYLCYNYRLLNAQNMYVIIFCLYLHGLIIKICLASVDDLTMQKSATCSLKEPKSGINWHLVSLFHSNEMETNRVTSLRAFGKWRKFWPGVKTFLAFKCIFDEIASRKHFRVIQSWKNFLLQKLKTVHKVQFTCTIIYPARWRHVELFPSLIENGKIFYQCLHKSMLNSCSKYSNHIQRQTSVFFALFTILGGRILIAALSRGFFPN